MTAIDVCYLTWNRRAYTEASLPALIANTDWSHVRHFHVFDDGSRDGTDDYVRDLLGSVPAEATFHPCAFRSPVATMRHYLADHAGDVWAFAKIDSDIVVPPGWLEALAAVAIVCDVELLGFQPGMSNTGEYADALAPVARSYVPAPHIGGVGLMRLDAFKGRPALQPRGRFGFTEWQQADPTLRRGWVTPELLAFELDRLPDPPWPELARTYRARRWQREWPRYPESFRPYWSWWSP